MMQAVTPACCVRGMLMKFSHIPLGLLAVIGSRKRRSRGESATEPEREKRGEEGEREDKRGREGVCHRIDRPFGRCVESLWILYQYQ